VGNRGDALMLIVAEPSQKILHLLLHKKMMADGCCFPTFPNVKKRQKDPFCKCRESERHLVESDARRRLLDNQ